MNLKVTLMIAILSVLCHRAQALLLTKSAARSCIGEEVVFTCSLTEGVYSLYWSLIVTRNSDIPALKHTFFHGDYEVQSHRMVIWQLPDIAGFHVELELVSTEPVLVSTLSANLTGILIDAKVTCEQSYPEKRTQSDYFTLTSIPSVPVEITEIDDKYGCTSFNMSLSLTPPRGNYQIDNYQLRIHGQLHTCTTVNDTSFMIDSLPYFENITVEVAIINCAGVGAESNITIAKGGCLEPQTHNSSEDSCIKPAGYQTVIECDHGELILSTCQENGSWIPDSTTECSVRCHIPTFYHDTTVMITNNGVHNDSFTNYTTKGAEIQLLCKNGTNQTDGSMTVFRAVCRENGMWLPDLSEHECTSDQSKQKIQPWKHFRYYIIAGASTGCGILTLLIVICGLVCIIRKLCTKRGRNHEQTYIEEVYSDSEIQCKLGELNQDTSIPQYDTISPIYEMIPESLHHSQNSLKMMNNDAYSESVKYTL